jgi:adenylate kinase family enzyme
LPCFLTSVDVTATQRTGALRSRRHLLDCEKHRPVAVPESGSIAIQSDGTENTRQRQLDNPPRPLKDRRMSRIVIIGNAGGGKSTMARKLAQRRGLTHIEIDRLLWREGWEQAPADLYKRQHEEAIAGDNWVIDGVGQQASIAPRIARATDIILIDMPLWSHFWLACERQIAWAGGQLKHTPGGLKTMPPTKALCQAIWEVDQNWMPGIRTLCDEAQAQGKTVTRLNSIEALDRFATDL